MPQQQAIAFEVADGEREHSLRDALNAFLECRKTQAVARGHRKMGNHKDRPFIAKPGQHTVRHARFKERPCVGFFVRATVYEFVQGYQLCA